MAVTAIPLFYGYNSEKLQQADIPKSALDFLKPQLRGKIVTAYPADDDATLYNFELIAQKYGWTFMYKNTWRTGPDFMQGHRDVAARVRPGAEPVSFDMSSGSVRGPAAASGLDHRHVRRPYKVAGLRYRGRHPGSKRRIPTPQSCSSPGS